MSLGPYHSQSGFVSGGDDEILGPSNHTEPNFHTIQMTNCIEGCNGNHTCLTDCYYMNMNSLTNRGSGTSFHNQYNRQGFNQFKPTTSPSGYFGKNSQCESSCFINHRGSLSDYHICMSKC